MRAMRTQFALAKPVARSFSSSGWREPSFMVTTDSSVDPSVIKVPLVLESTKKEIFTKFKTNPNEWSVSKLSQTYGASVDRIKAIIFLLQQRENMMTSLGVAAGVPQLWSNVFERYKEKKFSEDILASISSEFSIGADEVKNIITNMKSHQHRTQNLSESEEEVTSLLNRLSARGVDVRFRETKAHGAAGMADNYYPRLFGDDEYESVQSALLRRVSRETKASINEDKDWLPSSDRSDVDTINSGWSVACTETKNKTGIVSRWKFAFRDTSNSASMKATTIRTRSGK